MPDSPDEKKARSAADTDLTHSEAECHVLLVAGDVSTDLELLEQTLTHLQTLFNRVFFVPGATLWHDEFGVVLTVRAQATMSSGCRGRNAKPEYLPTVSPSSM